MIIDEKYGATFYAEEDALVFSPDFKSEWDPALYIWRRNSVYFQMRLQGEVRLI